MTTTLETAKAQIADLLQPVCGDQLEIKHAPPNVDAQLAVPLFRAAKEQRTNPKQLAQDVADSLAPKLADTLFADVSVAGGFLNFRFDAARYRRSVVDDFRRLGDGYGGSDIGHGKTVVIDYSSPNIAKPFSVGHLRSTVIGQSIKNILTCLGYTVIGDNHIGDWGTQFGKLLRAFELWGDRGEVEKDPIRQLLALYVRFHDEAEQNPVLEEEARTWFRRLEDGDAEAVALWKWVAEVSWQDFQRIYSLLGVEFEEVLGESFYNDRLQPIVDELFERGLAEWSVPPQKDNAEKGHAQGEIETKEDPAAADKVALVHLEEHGIDTPLLIQKSDGTSLYATRDLATIRYRCERWQPVEVLYVVGAEQKLYFQQLFLVAGMLGCDTQCVHVPFGLIRLAEGKMSTRKGRVIFLEDVLAEAVRRAEEVIEDRDLSAEEKRDIARKVGLGAVKFADLSQTRTKDVLFDWDKMLSLQGDTSPYLQYAHARIRSMLRSAAEQGREEQGHAEEISAAQIDADLLTTPEETALLEALARFPEAIQQAAVGYLPHLIANYLLALAKDFSAFYREVPVLRAEGEALRLSRLGLCAVTAQVLQRGLGLLGIECPEKM